MFCTMAPDVEKRTRSWSEGPRQDLLYEHFSRLFDGRDGVMVVRDGGARQRRHGGSTGAREPAAAASGVASAPARAAGVAHREPALTRTGGWPAA